MDWPAVFAAVVGTFGTAISGYIVWWLKQQHLNSKSSDYALTMLLKAQLRNYHLTTHEKGEVTYDELEDVHGIHKAYNTLGGNGAGDRMVVEIAQLPKR